MAQTKKTKTKQSQTDTIYFKLSDSSLKFATPDKKVDLNRLDGKTSGSVSTKDKFTWNMVNNALYQGILVQTDTKEKDEDPADEIDVTNFAETNNSRRLQAASYLRKLKKEALLEKITELKDPQLIATMIEQESYGRNTSKRKREEVIKALKKRLNDIKATMEHKKASSMIAYTEAEEPKPVEYKPEA